MDQPKFKFGDKVDTVPTSPHDTSKSFNIGSIYWNGNCNCYEYGSICGGFSNYREDSVELSKVPKIYHQALMLDSSLKVYMVPDALFESEAVARKYAGECRVTFVRFIASFEVET